MITKEELDKLEELAKGAASREWCEGWCYSAIRHVSRNCDIECGTHGKDSTEECNSFGRHDGPYIAYANPDRIKRLIDAARRDPNWCYTCDRPESDCGCVENGGTY